MKKIIPLAVVAAGVLILYSKLPVLALPGWQQKTEGWTYESEGGRFVKNGWQKVRDHWYYFDQQGIMKTEWISDGGKWYYLRSDGAMHTGWLELSGQWYYLNTDGSMAADTTIDGWKIGGNGVWQAPPDIHSLAAGTVLTTEQLALMDRNTAFYQEEISDAIYARMAGKSYRPDGILALSELCYVKVLHYGFDGQTHVGELVVNKKIAGDILTIFTKLYEANYPIEKMLLVDEYGANDELSMENNNTSAFNYRLIEGTTTLSRHGMGMAVDINPLYNPYVRVVNGVQVCLPANSGDYVDRSRDFAYKIDTNDLAYQLFVQHGFTWGGHWNSLKDYQHFEK